MRILLDTNILIDYISYREPHAYNAKNVLSLCKEKKIFACLAAQSIPDILYILRKDFPVSELKAIILSLCHVLHIVGIDSYKIFAALENNKFDDFEDCLQAECAKEYHANYIITRNGGDFSGSAIPALEPGAFLALVSQGDEL